MMEKIKSMGFLLVPALSVALMGILFFVSTAGQAWARPFRMGRIPATEFGCGACHVNQGGGGTRNSFGKDYASLGIAAGDRFTDELGALDSDGDGYSNAQEFREGAHPGDPDSKPSK